MNNELLNQIGMLNERMGDLIDVINQNKGLDKDTIITGAIGIIGVVVGAFISYLFTKRITTESSKARFAIQRKNLIYSKIYKELVHMKEQMDLLPSGSFYFHIRTNLLGHEINEWYPSNYSIAGIRDYVTPDFFVWKEIKSDIRRTLINNQILSIMNALEEVVILYEQSREAFLKKLQDIEKRQGVSALSLDYTRFFFDNFDKSEFALESAKNFGGENSQDLMGRIGDFSDVITADKELKDISANFKKLKKALIEACMTLEELIKTIVKKYEYGEEI